jgi:hypothetical protein
MAKSKEILKTSADKESGAERASRFLRNFNALGAVAMAGAAIVVPAGAAAFNFLAAVNVAQTAGFEWARRKAQKSRLKKTTRLGGDQQTRA